MCLCIKIDILRINSYYKILSIKVIDLYSSLFFRHEKVGM